MGWLDKIRSTKKVTPLAANRPLFEAVNEKARWAETKLTSTQMLEQYKGWSFIAARLNGESVASQQIHLYAVTRQNQDRIKNFSTKEVDSKTVRRLIKEHPYVQQAEYVEEIFDHPALDLMYKVNDFSNYSDNFQLTQIYQDMTGNAYWFITKDTMGVPTGIYQLRPDLVKVKSGKTRLIVGYLYGNKDPSAFKVDEVVRFNVPNPNNFWYGQSCIEAGMASVSRQNLYDVYENSQLKNMGRPDFAVKYTGNLTAEDMKKLTAQWNRLYTNPNNAGKIKIFDNNWEIQELGFTPEEMKYLEGRKMTQREICLMFGVPYSLLDTSDQLKAGLDQIMPVYQRFTLKPRLTRIAETLTEQYLPMFDTSGDLFFDYDDPVDENQDFILKSNVEYKKAGIISVNEARARIGMDPVEGGDEVKENLPPPVVGNEEAPKEDEKPEVDEEEDDE